MSEVDRDDILRRADEFVAGWVERRGELLRARDFPDDVWRGLADSGLLGLSLPAGVGGLGGDYATLAAAARRLTARGGVMGVTLSWLGHNMNTRLHLWRHGTADQRAALLPRLAGGEGALAIAISEPGVGGHPKHLKTSARRDGDEFVIDGEKSYLTNGPLAALFIVLAVTGEVEGRMTFSALLVPREAPGLRITPGIEIDFLHPSPHCGLELDGCRVPTANLLGAPDTGLAEISLPTRAVEDALNAATLAGALRAQLRGIGDIDAGDAADFGMLLGQVDALDHLAAAMAAELDADEAAPERLNPVSAGYRGLVRGLQNDIDAFLDARGRVLSPDDGLLRRDILKSLDIAASVHRVLAAKRAQAFIREEKQT